MADPDIEGGRLGVVAALRAFAILTLAGGVILGLVFIGGSRFGVGATLAGLAYIVSGAFGAALLFALAHLVQDVHDVKRRLKTERPTGSDLPYRRPPEGRPGEAETHRSIRPPTRAPRRVGAYYVRARGLGVLQGVELDRALRLAAALEDEEILRKLALLK